VVSVVAKMAEVPVLPVLPVVAVVPVVAGVLVVSMLTGDPVKAEVPVMPKLWRWWSPCSRPRGDGTSGASGASVGSAGAAEMYSCAAVQRQRPECLPFPTQVGPRGETQELPTSVRTDRLYQAWGVPAVVVAVVV
jgi:hypothetical protein